LTPRLSVIAPNGKPPYLLIVATFLVYLPMSLAGWSIGHLFFDAPAFIMGQTLVGALPTDVSAPLLVLLARGHVALAAVMNAVNTALAPVMVPLLFLLYTGEAVQLPAGPLILELCAVILLPMGIGVWLRTRFAAVVAAHEPLYSFGASLLYLLLLLAVVGVNAAHIIGYGGFAARILAAQLLLNLTGYAIALAACRWIPARGAQIALLFTVSKKEFSIAAVLVFRAGLPPEVAVPAAFYAVLQMITSPLAVAILNRAARKNRQPTIR
jgi:bile acid:Na+ symporter, BASS family